MYNVVIVHLWMEKAAYKKVMKIIKSLKVVNDAAERGIALVIIFNLRHADEKQFLSQMVEIHHTWLPHPRTGVPNCELQLPWEPQLPPRGAANYYNFIFFHNFILIL